VTRVLVVAYFFPPKGGAGTQRFAKFCKFLPEHGIEPIVLGAGADLRNRNAPNDDPTLVTATAAVVERVAQPRRMPFSFWLRRKLRFYLDEDVWAHVAAERAVGLAKEHAVQAVVTTLSPFACYRIGERLRAQLGVPWIVDLRDPWSLDGWRRYRSAVHARWDLGHMRRALAGADFVIANVPEAARAFIELGADPARTVVIPNGFDEEDFEGVAATPRQDGRFRLVHMGTLHGIDAAEGLTRNTLTQRQHRQIEPLGRTGHYLLHALARLQEQIPDLRRRLVVALYGNVDASHRDLAKRLGVTELIEEHGYVAHRESTAALLGADAVFVPLHGIPVGERALVVPGKLYEALASERPVLAALPPGDGVDLLQHLQAGLSVPPTDAAALAAAVRELLEQHERGTPRTGCTRDRLRVFTRRHLTALLAAVVDAAVARESAVAIEDPWRALGVGGGEG
jgi:glycosyltransferase involved in cell wall biosynthesis